MNVERISNTVQKFNGQTYYLCGKYYQRKGNRLHLDVWKYHNGEIPDGYHVHHIDGDVTNNDISNLTLLTATEHARLHMTTDERRELSRELVKKAIEAAPAWHCSEAGKEWHSKHAKEYWENAPLQTYVCDFCGKEYQTKNVRHKGHHFCHQNCKMKYRTRRLRHESEECATGG